jgi:hypothetical protein
MADPGDSSAKPGPKTPPSDDDPSVPSPLFHDFIMLLEDISKRRTDKTQLLRKYFKVCQHTPTLPFLPHPLNTHFTDTPVK